MSTASATGDELSPSERARLALGLFSPLIRETLVEDHEFRSALGIPADFILTLGSPELRFARSSLFQAIRAAFSAVSATSDVTSESGETWTIAVEQPNTGFVRLSQAQRRGPLLPFWPLLPDRERRGAEFDRQMREHYLPASFAEDWGKLVEKDALSDDEVDRVLEAFRTTPIAVLNAIEAKQEGDLSIGMLVPRDARYYRLLIGASDTASDISEFAQSVSQPLVHNLMNLGGETGLKLALALASHSSISDIIDLSLLGKEKALAAYMKLAEDADPISTIGAVEAGLSQLHEWPEIAAPLVRLIRRLIDDDADKPDSQYAFLSGAFTLVDGELSSRGSFRQTAPFVRRFASLTQAGLITNLLWDGTANVQNFVGWAMQRSGLSFFVQSLVDLHREPRWLPDFATAQQFKAELAGRAFFAASKHRSAVCNHGELEELTADREGGELRSNLVFPKSLLPGPLEGGVEALNPLPDALQPEWDSIEAASVLNANAIARFLNASLIHRVEVGQADKLAEALVKAGYRVKVDGQPGGVFSVLGGLAVLAASTRSKRLATEIRPFARRVRENKDHTIEIEAHARVILVAAAAFEDEIEWARFVGDSFRELAFAELDVNEINFLITWLLNMRAVSPRTGATISRVLAALEGARDAGTQPRSRQAMLQ
jgi:hypothetical protein